MTRPPWHTGDRRPFAPPPHMVDEALHEIATSNRPFICNQNFDGQDHWQRMFRVDICCAVVEEVGRRTGYPTAAIEIKPGGLYLFRSDV